MRMAASAVVAMTIAPQVNAVTWIQEMVCFINMAVRARIRMTYRMSCPMAPRVRLAYCASPSEMKLSSSVVLFFCGVILLSLRRRSVLRVSVIVVIRRVKIGGVMVGI